jgi:hypothetical protein
VKLIYSIHEALVRQDERERRRNELGKNPESESKKKVKKKKELPMTAKVSIRFGLSTLLNLIEMAGINTPQIYALVINSASKILADLPPMSLDVDDPDIISAIE